MKISVIGTGYVGLVTGTCFAELGNEVICSDIDEGKIYTLKKGGIPIYEPGLKELIDRNVRGGRISFTTDVGSSVKHGEVVFIAVGTPPGEDGSADLKYVKDVAKTISENIDSYKIIVNKSTVPVGTGDIVSDIIKEKYKGEFDVVSNPEFLREGSAVQDSLHPDRVVIGNGNERARKIMEELYKPLECPILFTDVKSAEIIKYASNSLLATEISFINSIARLAEKVGANIQAVSEGMKLDRRIGKSSFLNAGCGYGGSCFPKDVKALVKTLTEYKANPCLLRAVESINDEQKLLVVKKLKTLIPKLKGKKVGIWGLAFKPNTDDLREAVSLAVIPALLKEEAKVAVFDPAAISEAKKIFKDAVTYCRDSCEVLKESDALIILTEWDEFKQIDKNKVKKLLRVPNIVDGRNIFDPRDMKKLGFNYLSIGR
ncbi:MAG: UDP-glucose 6-dehydrogenase [Candidatus Kerfeldbacteria bacterium CG08_land_8_20_14_0_20_40_16]|uniref:UDP-glucose 6-dehydrogenase n=1 Tax=Candidatus Kerfeldbacteria bacterium CG08_land_8_20_14_0_20_40_16 TaxID=2014244 RepID=A0A2H0YWK2_9BACT|nr:MAG: UDP-glucose 6-dehydrogenase [Candidatus Kerfeldbacteria bacterium CG08_land_8_20_14_0_20_40_16]